MWNKIREIYKGINGRLRGLTREQWGRVGYYAALALLLAILGAASYAYRNRAGRQDAPEPAARTALSARAEALAHTPEPTAEPVVWRWPLEGEVIGAYSAEEPVFSKTLGQWQTHPALDIAGSPGEAVYACRDGVVSDAWNDRLWGNVIVIDHGEGWQSVYRGVNTLNLVAIGDDVRGGDVISAVAMSVPCEDDMAAHIHFELTRDGRDVDFAKLMEAP